MLVVLQKIIKIQLYNTVNMIKMSLLKTEMLSNNYSIVEFVGKLYLNLRVIAKLSVQ